MRTSITILLLFCSVLPTSGRPGGGKCASDQDCPSSHPDCSQSGFCQGRVGGGASAPSYPASPSPPSPGFRVPKTTSASSLEPSNTLPLTDQELSLGSALQKVFLQSKPLQKPFLKIVRAKLLPAVQLHFIQCPFPNQIQFGLEKLHPKITYHFPNQFQFGLERKKMILQDADSKPNSDWFGTI